MQFYSSFPIWVNWSSASLIPPSYAWSYSTLLAIWSYPTFSILPAYFSSIYVISSSATYLEIARSSQIDGLLPMISMKPCGISRQSLLLDDK